MLQVAVSRIPQLESELVGCKERISAGQRALQAAVYEASELRQLYHSAQDEIRRLQEKSMYSQTCLSARPVSCPVGCGARPQPTTHAHTHLTTLFPGLPGWAGTRKVKPIWISLKQETVTGSGISWAICKSAPCSRQITTPAPHHSVFYRPDALPDAQPTASKHWRHKPQPTN